MRSPVFHLYHRAGFGPSLDMIGKKPESLEKLVSKLIEKGQQIPGLTHADDFPFKSRKEIKALSPAQKKEFREMLKRYIKGLNAEWYEQMSTGEGVLGERMVLFWHNHFACREDFPPFAAELINVLRKHALGNFRDMLLEVSKTPAMLRFLNNLQNKKDHPNENFAREVMELFTLGIGAYTEQDIREAARAFTGWSLDEEGAFIFRQGVHDAGTKTVLGKSGNWKGEDIIAILLEHPATAAHICSKIYHDFVSHEVNSSRVEEMAQVFRKDYDIAALMRFVFHSDWFYAPDVQGAVIKSPAELLVQLNRIFLVRYEDNESRLMLQRALNQVLFFPPNVAGWPGGKWWIDNSTLMIRLRVASVLLNQGMMHWQEKGDMPEDFKSTKMERKIKAKADWSGMDRCLKDTSRQEMVDAFLPVSDSPAVKSWLSKQGSVNQEDVISLFSLPEFQLA